jgi:hypothetical protein
LASAFRHADVAALGLHDKLVGDLKAYMEDHEAAATIKHLTAEADTPEEQGESVE